MGARDAARPRWCRVVLSSLLSLAAIGAASAGDSTRLSLHVHVTAEAGKPVVSDAFVERQVQRANAIFAPYGVSFRVGQRSLLNGHAAMESRADRDALGAYAPTSGSIHCFFVKSLRDVDEPGRMRQGVHWRSRSHRPAHFVIVSSIAFEDVLAHELGHFLGNHRHSETPGNLMSYSRTGALPILDTTQQRRMRRILRGYLESGELRAMPQSGPAAPKPLP